MSLIRWWVLLVELSLFCPDVDIIFMFKFLIEVCFSLTCAAQTMKDNSFFGDQKSQAILNVVSMMVFQMLMLLYV